MKHTSEGISCLKIIPRFCENFCNTNNIKSNTQLNQELKVYLMKHLNVSKEADAKFLLGERTNQYYRRLNKEVKGYGRIVSGRPEINVTNIFSPVKSTCPSRLTLFEIAFALGLNDEECNEMLRAAGQYDIHLGGDPQESIIFFCLKKGLSHLDAIRMYERYCANDPLSKVLKENETNLSQRSQFIADELLKAMLIKDFDRSMQAFEQQLGLYAASYSYYSGRVRRYVLRLLEENTKKEKKAVNLEDNRTSSLCSDFCILFGRDKRGMSSELDKIYKAESHPTREFVYMLLCLDYYRNYFKNCKLYSLEEYINNWLDDFGMEELNNTRIIEALLLELSKYQFHNKKNNMVRYNSDSWIIVHSSNRSYIEQAAFILKEYTEEPKKEDFQGPKVYIPISEVPLIFKNTFLQDLFLKTPGVKKD